MHLHQAAHPGAQPSPVQHTLRPSSLYFRRLPAGASFSPPGLAAALPPGLPLFPAEEAPSELPGALPAEAWPAPLAEPLSEPS